MATPERPVQPSRGATMQPANRFTQIEVQLDYSDLEPEEAAEMAGARPKTVFLEDTSRSIIARNDSPDIGFEASVNPYRGCEHGCIYCYARPHHEYLGLSPGLDFETKIFVKRRAPELLRREIRHPRYAPVRLAFSGVTDCYQPVERTLRITRGCLEVLAAHRHPLSIVTKNHLVTRDLDLLRELARWDAVAVWLSVTTLDPALRRKMEPRTSSPAMRLRAIRELAAAGIPVGVIVGPVLPGLTEHEIPAIVQAAAEAGARFASYTMLRLPYAVKEIVATWLDEHAPDAKAKVLGRVRETRGGRLNDPRFGTRMRGTGVLADQVAAMFRLAVKRSGIPNERPPLSPDHVRIPGRTKPMFG